PAGPGRHHGQRHEGVEGVVAAGREPVVGGERMLGHRHRVQTRLLGGHGEVAQRVLADPGVEVFDGPGRHLKVDLHTESFSAACGPARAWTVLWPRSAWPLAWNSAHEHRPD